MTETIKTAKREAKKSLEVELGIYFVGDQAKDLMTLKAIVDPVILARAINQLKKNNYSNAYNMAPYLWGICANMILHDRVKRDPETRQKAIANRELFLQMAIQPKEQD